MTHQLSNEVRWALFAAGIKASFGQLENCKRELASWPKAIWEEWLLQRKELHKKTCELSALAQINIMEIEKAESIDFCTSY